MLRLMNQSWVAYNRELIIRTKRWLFENFPHGTKELITTDIEKRCICGSVEKPVNSGILILFQEVYGVCVDEWHWYDSDNHYHVVQAVAFEMQDEVNEKRC